MSKQNTNYQKIITNLGNFVYLTTSGPWKSRSLGLITVLIGYYMGSNVSSYLINIEVKKIIILICLLFLIEIITRTRTYFAKVGKFPIYLSILDNLRIGVTYSIVLEAFKLGS